MASSLSADVVGSAARYDQQFHVPQRPVLRRGVAVIDHEGQTLLCGVPKPQVLSGEFARSHLAALLQACDGSRTHAGIAQELSLGEEVVFKALAFLWSCGALEDEAAALPLGDTPPRIATLLSRLGDSTGVCRHWTEGVARLQGTLIHVAGDPEAGLALSGLLRSSSCRLAESVKEPGVGLVIFIDTTSSHSEAAAAGRDAWSRGVPFLRVAIRQDLFQIGPYVDPEFTPCLDCSLSGLVAPGECEADAAVTMLALGIASRSTVALLSRCMVTALPGDTMVMSPKTLRAMHAPAATRAGCPACGRAEGPMSPVPSLASVYEQSVAIPPRRFVDIKGHQAHYQPSNLKLQFEFRHYSGTATVALPEPDPGLLDRPGQGLSLETLGLVLSYAAGLRPRSEQGGKLRRWTAAGGNIGSVGARVVVNDPDILPVGTYAYNESEHTLTRLGEAAPGLTAPVTLIMTANVAKVARKYASFALRVSLQDGGCSTATARRVCEALAVPWQPVAHWDERALCAACHADPDQEPITTVTYLGGRHAH